MEEDLYEIASLRSFAGLMLNQPIPDESAILNLRHMLEANDLADDIFAAVNRHLTQQGLMLKQGSIVGATGERDQVDDPVDGAKEIGSYEGKGAPKSNKALKKA